MHFFSAFLFSWFNCIQEHTIVKNLISKVRNIIKQNNFAQFPFGDSELSLLFFLEDIPGWT
eukprot:maker-scaffold_21-snap-gene-5.26-mRNA-1 protein AED:0.14 eAED:0.48 QI:0/0/0.33/1/0/0/3/64/60